MVLRHVCFTVSLIAAALLVASPARADESQTRLAQSKETWLKLRDAAGGNYEYDVGFQSWTGNGHTTTILARGNKVVERRFRKFNRQQAAVHAIGPDGREVPQPRPVDESWTETAEQLGAHQGAAPAKTIDDLYADAEKVLAGPRQPHEKLYLIFHADGVLKGCFVVDTRIADDAPRQGPAIDAVRLSDGAK